MPIPSGAEQGCPVVALAGRTRAGKTTLATALGRRLAWPTTSFSAFVRATATRRGLPESRRTLQDLGAAMIEDEGARAFVLGALAQAGALNGPFVIEGVRHLVTLEALRQVVRPRALGLIYLKVSDGERDRRLELEGVAAAEGRVWETHSTERDVLDALDRAADLVIEADRPQDFVADTAIDWIAQVCAGSIRLPPAGE